MTDFEAQIAELQRALAEQTTKLAATQAELSTQKAVAARLGKDAQDKASKILELQHRLDLLARQLFGRKAERVDPNQLKLAFEQVTEEGEAPPPFVDEAPDEESEPRAKSKRKRNGRLKLPEDLPRERHEIHPPSEDLACPCGAERHEIHPPSEDLACPCGAERRRIGEEVTQLLDYQPASFKVVEHVRVKYACASCQEGVVCPDLPALPIDKKRPSRPGAGLLAELIVSRYGDYLPLNRLESVFERHGVRIAKSTLSDWIRDVSLVLEPITKEVARQVLSPSQGSDLQALDATRQNLGLRRASRPGLLLLHPDQRGQTPRTLPE
ncbi:MAG: transposase [Planctomycetes bacterium]|nr:transposase [Planctomycetota bacterium]